MTKTILATYDGSVLHPEENLEINPGSNVIITVKFDDDIKVNSFFQTAKLLKLDGPSDWSERLEDYLYKDMAIDD
jgi:predicted DNA-binding antitoxin AbrB/MazE fold protein